MTDACVVSANFGGIDIIRPFPASQWVDSFYYTDQIVDEAARSELGWNKIINPSFPRYDLNSRLRAKYFKCQLHRLDEASRYRWIVWCDSSFRIVDANIFAGWANQIRDRDPVDRIGFTRHVERQTVEQEYFFVRDLLLSGNEYIKPRYENEKIQQQIDCYRNQGFPLDLPLYNGGFFIAENNTYINSFLNDWWDQNIKFGVMDQLSLPVMLMKNRINPYVIDCDIRSNACFIWEHHKHIM